MLHDAIRTLPERQRLMIMGNLRAVLEQHGGIVKSGYGGRGERLLRFPSIASVARTSIAGSSVDADKLLFTQGSLISSNTFSTTEATPPAKDLLSDNDDESSSEEEAKSENQRRVWDANDQAAWDNFWACVRAGEQSWMDRYLNAEDAVQLKLETQRMEDPISEQALGHTMQLTLSQSFRIAPDATDSALISPLILSSAHRNSTTVDTSAINQLLREITDAVKPSRIVEANNTKCVHCGGRCFVSGAGNRVVRAPYTGVVGINHPPPQCVPESQLHQLDVDMWRLAAGLLCDNQMSPTERIERMKERLDELFSTPEWTATLGETDKHIRRARSIANAKRHAVQKKINCAVQDLKVVQAQVLKKNVHVNMMTDEERADVAQKISVVKELLTVEAGAKELQLRLERLREEEQSSSEDASAIAALHSTLAKLQTIVTKHLGKIQFLLDTQAPRASKDVLERVPLKIDIPHLIQEKISRGSTEGESRACIFGSERCTDCGMISGYSIYCPMTGRLHPRVGLHELSCAWNTDEATTKLSKSTREGENQQLQQQQKQQASEKMAKSMTDSFFGSSDNDGLRRVNTMVQEASFHAALEAARRKSSGEFLSRSVMMRDGSFNRGGTITTTATSGGGGGTVVGRRYSTGSANAVSSGTQGSDCEDQMIDPPPLMTAATTVDFSPHRPAAAPPRRTTPSASTTTTTNSIISPHAEGRKEGGAIHTLPTDCISPHPRDAVVSPTKSNEHGTINNNFVDEPEARRAAHVGAFTSLLRRLMDGEHFTVPDIENAPGYAVHALVLAQIARATSPSSRSPGQSPASTPLPSPKHRTPRNSPAPPRSPTTTKLQQQDSECFQLRKKIAKLNLVMKFVSTPVKDLLKSMADLELRNARELAKLKAMKAELAADRETLSHVVAPPILMKSEEAPPQQQRGSVVVAPSDGQDAHQNYGAESIAAAFVSGVALPVGAWRTSSPGMQ